ncbi:Dabb family protein [Clostridium sp. Ade.TY]|uniref:Dabb family protein n=1 Tax=Clostridium sp. Ade.TY TaxID=1391647 RepID=UPI00041F2589|nr:Dabb family protein [Clostridium sp. Ade.TY]
MIKHIVMWNLKEEKRMENAKKLKVLLEELKKDIKEIKEVEVGININNSDASMDVILYSVFNNLEDLNIYQDHPKHLKVKDFVKEIATDRKVVDYEV